MQHVATRSKRKRTRESEDSLRAGKTFTMANRKRSLAINRGVDVITIIIIAVDRLLSSQKQESTVLCSCAGDVITCSDHAIRQAYPFFSGKWLQLNTIWQIDSVIIIIIIQVVVTYKTFAVRGILLRRNIIAAQPTVLHIVLLWLVFLNDIKRKRGKKEDARKAPRHL